MPDEKYKQFLYDKDMLELIREAESGSVRSEVEKSESDVISRAEKSSKSNETAATQFVHTKADIISARKKRFETSRKKAAKRSEVLGGEKDIYQTEQFTALLNDDDDDAESSEQNAAKSKRIFDIPYKPKRKSAEKNANPHEGHRNRLRRSVLLANSDWQSLDDKIMVELLLTATTPRVDVVPIVNRLFDRFGSLRGILNASFSELILVKGVTVSSAVVLNSVLKIAALSELRGKSEDVTYANPDLFKDYFRAYFRNCYSEMVVCAYIDSSMHITEVATVARGMSDMVNIDFRRIVGDITRLNSYGIILAHNHLFGNAYPSLMDIEATRAIAEHLSSINAKLFDHIIVSPTDVFSFGSADGTQKDYITNSLINSTIRQLDRDRVNFDLFDGEGDE